MQIPLRAGANAHAPAASEGVSTIVERMESRERSVREKAQCSREKMETMTSRTCELMRLVRLWNGCRKSQEGKWRNGVWERGKGERFVGRKEDCLVGER